MKHYTDPLMNRCKKGIKSFLVGQSTEQTHYIARRYGEDVTLLWLEASQFGKIHCFPCVIKEPNNILLFQSRHTKAAKNSNNMLVQRWNQLVNTNNVQTDYYVEELDSTEFYSICSEYKAEEKHRAMNKVEVQKPEPRI